VTEKQRLQDCLHRNQQLGVAEAALVDALDEDAVEEHIASVVHQTRKIDVSFNAITPVPQPGVQGVPIAELSVD
jgi:hypothetical protein